MKKLLLTAAAILATLNMYGQQSSGIINFQNNGADNTRRIWINTTGVAGDGVLATGTGYKIALYWGSQGTPEGGLSQAGNAAGFLTGTAGGQFIGGSRTLTYTGGANGGIVTVQARAWQTIAGVPDTYEAVHALGLAGDPRASTGVGPVFDHDTKDPTNPQDIANPIGGPVATGGNPNWRGFGVSPVPEPSVIALGLLGAGALLMLRRRK